MQSFVKNPGNFRNLPSILSKFVQPLFGDSGRALASALLILAILSVIQNPASAQTFAPTGPMTAGRAQHSATLLGNGKVLVAGGYSGQGGNGVLASAEIYDPSTGTFSATDNMTTARQSQTETLLNNGEVLITGGYSSGPLASAELYDPAAHTFASTGSMIASRFGHTATLLADGKVLITGGADSGGTLASAELYDPLTGTFAATGTMTAARFVHRETLLNDGRVLITGGSNSGGNLNSAEVYDPSTETFSATGPMAGARNAHTATLLGDGKVLISGGAALATAELYDPVTGTFTATGSMTAARNYHRATLLNGGKVLITGGAGPDVLASAELYDPSTGSFSATSNMVTVHYVHTATLLQNGKVLVAGGEAGGAGAATLTSAELYTPAKLYQICSLYDQTKSVKGGSTVPIKLELCDSNGNDLSSSSITLHGVDLSPLSSEASAALEASGNANPDNDFRFDPTLGTSGGYIFNLSTKGLGSGTWGLDFAAGPTAEVHQVQFGVK
jgi:galactose oxidase-like protein/Kelch motif protein